MKMMTNLFSIFDPSSSILSLTWTMTLIPILLIPNPLWKKSTTKSMIPKTIINKFKAEVSHTLGVSTKGTESILLVMFAGIMMMNLTALYPQNFSVTAHLPVTLSLSLTIWLAIVSFGWAKNTEHMLIHLVPQGTPIPLMSFMVLIELISSLIRPITLCVRLTANLIAGHLLMSLLGNVTMQLTTTSLILALPAPLILTILETAVACIQAYVFMTLITLYTTEIK